MKTAISVPDHIFEEVDNRAQDLGISRSEFFAKAAEHYLAELQMTSLERALAEAIKSIGNNGQEPATQTWLKSQSSKVLNAEW
jgi:metal-responsive CopG/Arc/MetJ family transcriptional regulator